MKETALKLFKVFWDKFKVGALPATKTFLKGILIIAAGALVGAVSTVMSPDTANLISEILKVFGVDI